MKQFFGAFFGSILGILITGVVCAFIIGAIVAGSIKSAFDTDRDVLFSVKNNSVLHLKLEGKIDERGRENPFEDIDLGPFVPEGAMGLNDITNVLKKAKSDPKVKGVYLEIKPMIIGMASLEEIRNAIEDFRTSGKFVYSYSEGYSQKSYYLASAASKIFLHPEGSLEFKGLNSRLVFFKNALEKMNVEMQVFRHGKFKSAVEPFMLDKMSAANREQVETYLGSIWNVILQGISKDRNIPSEKLNQLADDLSINTPAAAVENKLIDATLYADEVLSLIKKDLKLMATEKIAFVPVRKYQKSTFAVDGKDKKLKKDKIAVIYAVGQIMSGEGSDETIGSDRIAKAIKDAREDASIKAIVMRVNSPGGSALASDVIWREVILTKKVKPFVVSMGDLAASGGYYISCAADRIFAQPNTITGSIGVFGLLPNAQKAFAEKLGIHVDTVNTNKNSDVGSVFRPVTTDEYAYIQSGVEKVYDTFIGRVADGRNTNKPMVDSIGQGRVWSGSDAININLVDELGGLEKAVQYAAKKAGTSDYRLVELPKRKDPLSLLLSKGEDDIETRIIQKNLGEEYAFLLHVKQLMNLKGVQALLPFSFNID
jgi:protease-4